MDVIQPSGRDDTIVLEPPSLIEIANDGSDVQPPIFRVPTEITELIFRQFRSSFAAPIALTHTCRRWRNIAVNDASLWTNIWIQTKYIGRHERLDNFLSFLGMQLDRTANLLLNIIWEADVGDGFYVETLQLLHQKAPFSRWRTLRLHITCGSQGDVSWPTEDAFTNLESLCVVYNTDDFIMRAIDRTITSRLKVLDLGSWISYDVGRLLTNFARSFTHISTVHFPTIPFQSTAPFLRENVVNVSLLKGEGHPFPHIRIYEVATCEFHKSSYVDLRNLTTLTISNILTLHPDCQVILPALRELNLGVLVILDGAKIETPALHTLHFMGRSGFGPETHWGAPTHLQRMLQQSGYLLSPKDSLICDRCLPPAILITLLSKSPQVTLATLRFDDWAHTQVVLNRLLGFKTDTDSRSAENEILCPKLSELRLDFDWELSGWLESKDWLIDALKARKEAGLMTPQSIYVGWKGEGTYMLLTGGRW